MRGLLRRRGRGRVFEFGHGAEEKLAGAGFGVGWFPGGAGSLVQRVQDGLAHGVEVIAAAFAKLAVERGEVFERAYEFRLPSSVERQRDDGSAQGLAGGAGFGLREDRVRALGRTEGGAGERRPRADLDRKSVV